MATLRNYVRFPTRESKTETKWFEVDQALGTSSRGIPQEYNGYTCVGRDDERGGHGGGGH